MERRYTILLGIGVALGLSAPAHAQEVWVKTSNQDCEIASDATLKENEAVSWSGSCHDGRASGSGRLEWKVDGTLTGDYDGAMSDGRFNGEGVIRIQLEPGQGFDRLEGTFVKGKPEGEARYDAANGDYYVGDFHNGQRHGLGYYRLVSGEEYHGDFRNGERHGVGLLIDAAGTAFLGQFENGHAKGSGILENSDGSKYQGQFDNSLPHGMGTFVAPNGDSYQGHFTAGKANGKVLVTKADGTQMIEDWANGEKVK